MSKAVILDKNFKKNGEIELPADYADINPHNLYLYVKSYEAALRANTAVAKTRSDVSGGGKKPYSQKGGGRARAGSTRSPVWVGGGVAHGPKNNRNYHQKVNKKQKKLALKYAIYEKADLGKLYVVDSVEVSSGKTKDAAKLISNIDARSVLVVKELIDEKSFYAFRNLKNATLVEQNELNGFTASLYDAVMIEKSAFYALTKED